MCKNNFLTASVTVIFYFFYFFLLLFFHTSFHLIYILSSGEFIKNYENKLKLLKICKIVKTSNDL